MPEWSQSRRGQTRHVRNLTPIAAICVLCALPWAIDGQGRPRARDLGVPFVGTPGPLNAMTDVAGVTVGQATIISGEGPLVVGQGPVRTGVTAVLPRGADTQQKPAFAGWFSLNGNGEMTGTTWVEESGFLEGPVLITNTHSVGVVRDAAIAWRINAGPPDASGFRWALPVVAETWDGYLNDINGMHVKPSHVVEALESARGGPVAEGSVGGGTGMVCYGFKGGIGTASRRLGQRAIRWECCSRRTLVSATSSLWPACPSGRKSRTAPHAATPAWKPRRPGRSSSWWQRTRRSCRTS
jgi:D-aminopeptidase